jgi:hypothetical protein
MAEIGEVNQRFDRCLIGCNEFNGSPRAFRCDVTANGVKIGASPRREADPHGLR